MEEGAAKRGGQGGVGPGDTGGSGGDMRERGTGEREEARTGEQALAGRRQGCVGTAQVHALHRYRQMQYRLPSWRHCALAHGYVAAGSACCRCLCAGIQGAGGFVEDDYRRVLWATGSMGRAAWAGQHGQGSMGRDRSERGPAWGRLQAGAGPQATMRWLPLSPAAGIVLSPMG